MKGNELEAKPNTVTNMFFYGRNRFLVTRGKLGSERTNVISTFTPEKIPEPNGPGTMLQAERSRV
jgi:hypothetical protein